MILRTVSLTFAASVVLPVTFLACTPAESESTTPEPEPNVSAQFTAGPFNIASGEDKTVCTYVRAEADAEQDIAAFITEQSQGGHHLIVYTIDHPVDGEPFECPQGGQPSWTQVLATQLESEKIEFPAGVGFRVKAKQQYVMETHFLNTTDGPLDVTSHFKVVYADPGTVKERAATYFFGSMNIDIPPSSSAEVTAQCQAPKAMAVHTMFGHQHRMGTKLEVSRKPGGKGGDMIYHSTDWENPEVKAFDGGIDVAPDDVMSVTCNWENTGTARLRYPHEMCFAIGYYWPADAGLFCVTGGGSDECQCREQGSLDTGPGGAEVNITVRRKAEIAGTGGDIDGGAPIYCALFRAEDYGPFGPKPGTQPYYFRDVVDAPLVDDQTAVTLDIRDVTPGEYAVSCMMDVIGGGFVPGKGDVANLTAPKVAVKQGDAAKVEVTLDIAIP